MRLVTVPEAANYTGRPEGTVWRWINEGRLTRHTEDGRTKVNLDEVSPRTAKGPGPIPPRK